MNKYPPENAAEFVALATEMERIKKLEGGVAFIADLFEAAIAPQGLVVVDKETAADAARIDFLETWSKRSRTGVSIEWSPEDHFRVMTFHKVDQGQRSIRQAIDAAIGLRT